MREAVSKLSTEMEVVKRPKMPKKDWVVQTELVESQAVSTQTKVRTYANVASQSEEVIERGKATNKMDIDPPASSKPSGKPKGVTPLPKPTHEVTI